MNLEINDQEIGAIRKAIELYLSNTNVDVSEHTIYKGILDKMASLQAT